MTLPATCSTTWSTYPLPYLTFPCLPACLMPLCLPATSHIHTLPCLCHTCLPCTLPLTLFLPPCPLAGFLPALPCLFPGIWEGRDGMEDLSLILSLPALAFCLAPFLQVPCLPSLPPACRPHLHYTHTAFTHLAHLQVACRFSLPLCLSPATHMPALPALYAFYPAACPDLCCLQVPSLL